MKGTDSWLTAFSRWCCIALLGFLLPAELFAQNDIPLGNWRMHLSFTSVRSIAVSNDHVYGATESGVLVFDKSDKSLSSLNKLNGLSSAGITCIAFDSGNEQLIVAYKDGNLDIIRGSEVVNFNRLKNLASLTESKA